jgi:hypothetical protein
MFFPGTLTVACVTAPFGFAGAADAEKAEAKDRTRTAAAARPERFSRNLESIAASL